MGVADVVWLFSYGTLRQPEVQIALFGRRLHEELDGLPGYRSEEIEIDDPDVIAKSGEATHLIVRASGAAADVIEGAALEVTEAELLAADAYETDAYRRVTVRLVSGREAFVYVGD